MLTENAVVQFAPIRQLGPDDLPSCVALSVDRGWLPDHARWGLLLGVSEVFGIDAPDGQGLAGAVVLTRYGTDLASVGMMLVAARYERRGLGRALMEHLLRAAGDDTTVTLFATSLGRPLYEKLGFVPVRRCAQYVGHLTAAVPAPGNSKKREALVRAAVPDDLPVLLDLDRAAFGSDRSPVIRAVAALADRIAVAENGDGTVTGYAVAWRNDVSITCIGPLVAPDDETAHALVTDVAAGAVTPVRLDLDPDRPGLPAWAQAHGLAAGAVTTVMARGALPRRGTPAALLTPVSVALA